MFALNTVGLARRMNGSAFLLKTVILDEVYQEAMNIHRIWFSNIILHIKVEYYLKMFATTLLRAQN